MKIPKFVVDLMGRSQYEYLACLNNENYAAGYTIKIWKSTERTLLPTFQKEIDRLKKWVEKQPGGEMHQLFMPYYTEYRPQAVVITIYDPVMQHIEKYMPEAKK